MGNLENDEESKSIRDYEDAVETGFQIATFQGPLCAEPVEGMAYFVEAVTLDREGIEQEQGIYHRYPFRITLIFAFDSIEQDGPFDWVFHLCCTGCLSQRSARLVAKTDACYVHL